MDADADNSSTVCAKLLPWLSTTLQGLNGGMRRVDNELVVAICNYPAMGVISSARQHFVLSQVTSLAHSFPRSFVAIIVLPNRAADLRNNAKCWPEKPCDNQKHVLLVLLFPISVFVFIISVDLGWR